MKKRTARQLLLKAANHMQRHGWCRKRNEDAEGRVCLIGALSAVADRYGYYDTAYADALCRLRHHLKMAISTWNDHICKSKARAVRTLRAAAKVAL